MKEEGANQWKDFWLLLEKIRELDRDEHIIRFNEGYLALSSGLDSNLLETNKKKNTYRIWTKLNKEKRTNISNANNMNFTNRICT